MLIYSVITKCIKYCLSIDVQVLIGFHFKVYLKPYSLAHDELIILHHTKPCFICEASLLEEVPPLLGTEDTDWFSRVSITQQPCLDYGSDKPLVLIFRGLFHRFTCRRSVLGWTDVVGGTLTNKNAALRMSCAVCQRKYSKMFLIRRWKQWPLVCCRAFKKKKKKNYKRVFPHPSCETHRGP